MIITVDYREKPSGIIELLINEGFRVITKQLPWCDYVINDEIFIERKTGRDFLLSIIDGRLFKQAKVMKKKSSRPVFLVEGNPFHTDMEFNHESIKGAILSIQIIWYIPIIFSTSKENTSQILRRVSHLEQKRRNLLCLRHGYRPKKMITKQLYMVQGLPGIGPVLAKRLLDHFGSVGNVMRAGTEELVEVEGIGMEMAEGICKLLEHPCKKGNSS